MVANEIYAAVALGVILRIIATDGYITMPTFVEGKLQLNIAGTIGFGILGAALAAYFGLPGFESFGGALVTAYSVPYAIDKIVTKSPLGNVTEPVVEEKVPEVTEGVPEEITEEGEA